MKKKVELQSPISSGWRGHLSGHLSGTKSEVHVSEVLVKLDAATAFALCNVLTEDRISEGHWPKNQHDALMNLGAAIGRLVDHQSANNGGRDIIK